MNKLTPEQRLQTMQIFFQDNDSVRAMFTLVDNAHRKRYWRATIGAEPIHFMGDCVNDHKKRRMFGE